MPWIFFFFFIKGGDLSLKSVDRGRKISPSEWQLSLSSWLSLFLEMQLPASVTDVVLPLLALQPDPGA